MQLQFAAGKDSLAGRQRTALDRIAKGARKLAVQRHRFRAVDDDSETIQSGPIICTKSGTFLGPPELLVSCQGAIT